jgi:CBS domain containing-hemolysin-like protein
MRLLMRRKGPEGPTEDEIVHFSRLAAKQGAVRREELRWIENALRLDQMTAGDLRTPRTVVESLAADVRLSTLAEEASRWVHSRIPVTEGGDPDRVVGLAFRREVFDAIAAARGDLCIGDLMHPIAFVPESMRANELLRLFIRERKHMVAVADEYGGFEGVVTLEDVLEYLIGAEIVDEHDEVADTQELARSQNPYRHLTGT